MKQKPYLPKLLLLGCLIIAPEMELEHSFNRYFLMKPEDDIYFKCSMKYLTFIYIKHFIPCSGWKKKSRLS